MDDKSGPGLFTTGGWLGLGEFDGLGEGLPDEEDGEGVGDDHVSTVNPGSVSSQRPFALSDDELRLISIGLILKL